MTASASAAVNSCTFEEMFIEQNLGPHADGRSDVIITGRNVGERMCVDGC